MRTGVSPKRIATGKFFCCLLPPRAVRSPIHKSFGFISWTPGLLYTLASVRPGKPASLSGHLQVSALGSQQPTSNPTLTSFLRNAVSQPHLPIRLPCYDFTPVISPAFGGSFLSVRSPTSGITYSHGVTGGVYKTRERIHRGILIRDY